MLLYLPWCLGSLGVAWDKHHSGGFCCQGNCWGKQCSEGSIAMVAAPTNTCSSQYGDGMTLWGYCLQQGYNLLGGEHRG